MTSPPIRPHWVPRALVLGAALALPAAAQQPAPAPATAAPAPNAAKPVAVFPDFTHEFGEVTRGEKLHYAFTVKNTGTAELDIVNVAPT
jgi:hypothetical protein